MEMKISKVEEVMKRLLLERGLPEREAGLISSDYLAAEMRGRSTHGITKFLKELDYIAEERDTPVIVIDNGALVLVDARREVGQLAASFCTDIVIDRAKRYGISVVGMKNAKRYGTLEPWATAIAKNDLIGIITNICEPAGAPYGAFSAVLGSNPLAVGIPTLTEPIVLDMATTEVSMSTIWNSMMEKKELPNNIFFDKQGRYTTDPYTAVAAEIFGGHKGYGISVALEILGGSLVSAMMGSTIESPYDLGYYFQAINPSVFRDIEEFKAENTKLVDEIKSAGKKPGTYEIFLPGEQGNRRYKKAIDRGTIDLPEDIVNVLMGVSR